MLMGAMGSRDSRLFDLIKNRIGFASRDLRLTLSNLLDAIIVDMMPGWQNRRNDDDFKIYRRVFEVSIFWYPLYRIPDISSRTMLDLKSAEECFFVGPKKQMSSTYHDATPARCRPADSTIWILFRVVEGPSYPPSSCDLFGK